MTFTSKQQVDMYTATLETASEETESAAFSPSYENATIINSSLYNKTTSGSKSQRLSAANADEIVGLAKSLSVMPGDTVHIRVYGKYYTPTNTNSNAATAMLASMAQAFGVSGASTGEALKVYNRVYNRLDEMFGSGFLLTSEDWEDEEAPKAFLNYILFDKDFVPYDMGWDQIDAGALETGMNVTHDELVLLAPVTKPGYIYIYLSNENEKLVDVYFDDLTIEHKLSPVLQQDDYYPFGLAFNSYTRENATDQNYKFNGKELQDELDLNWLDHGARMYDPALGRWWVIDPLTDKYTAWSPYAFSFNNPILFWDPTGMEGIVVSGQPGDHKNKEHFLVNGLDRAKKLQKGYDKAGNGEKATWIVYNNGDPENGGFSAETIDKYKEKAEKAGIELKVVSDSDEIVDYVNEKNGDDSRSKDQISDFVYVGHALPGELSVGYESHNWLDELTHDSLDPADFNKEAFKENSNANLVGGCRTCVPSTFGKSAADKMAEKVGGEVKGSDVRVYYPGGVVSDEVLVQKNGGKIIVIPAKGKGKQ